MGLPDDGAEVDRVDSGQITVDQDNIDVDRREQVEERDLGLRRGHQLGTPLFRERGRDAETEQRSGTDRDHSRSCLASNRWWHRETLLGHLDHLRLLLAHDCWRCLMPGRTPEVADGTWKEPSNHALLSASMVRTMSQPKAVEFP